MPDPQQLGFPAPLLGEQPFRLPVLFDDGEVLVVVKPSGVLVREDSWYPRTPVLIEAIRYQAAAGKPEFSRLEIPRSGLWAVNDLDPECHGPVLLSRSRDIAEVLKEAYGSRQFQFCFELIGEATTPESSFSCELPLARHRTQKRMLVSHATGKQAETHFELLRHFGRYDLVQARTSFPRLHQVLLHGTESGFRVLGDPVYAKTPPPLLSRFKRDYRPRKDREEQPLYPGPAYRLASIRPAGFPLITCPPHSKWNALVRQLSRHDGTGQVFSENSGLDGEKPRA